MTPSQEQSGSPDPIPPPVAKRWHVGTLTYSAAGLAALFCWLLWGDFAWALKERAVTPVAQLMLRGFEAPDWLIGMLVGSIPCAIGMILGPVIGVKSDRHRGRWGRRIPFMLVPAPVIMLSMFGLAVTPSVGTWLHSMMGAHSPGEMTCRIMAFGFFWGIFEIGTVIVNVLFGALINDVVPQAIIGRFFALFRLVSLLAGIIFNFYLMGSASTHYFEIFAGIGLLCGVGFMLMCFMVKEGEYPPPPPVPADKKGRLAAVSSYLKECFSKPYYLSYFLAVVLGGFAAGPVNTFSVFHSRSVGMSDDLYGKSLAVSYAISLILSYPLGILADRFHPLRLAITAMVLYAAAALYGFLFATGVTTFFVAFVLHTVISGVYFTGIASIGQRLLPRAKYAEFASAASMVGAICYMILPPLLGVFIQRMNHDYRYVFLLGSVIAAGSVVAYVLLFRRFKELGGDKAYVAPE